MSRKTASASASARWRRNNPGKAEESWKRWNLRNPNYHSNWHKAHKSERLLAAATWAAANPEKAAAACARWTLRNRSKIVAMKRLRRAADPLYRLKINLRNRARYALLLGGWRKTARTHSLLGASFDTVQRWIESRFTERMSWDNYGRWHIDHIVPLCSAKTKKELVALFHYKNLQPLWAEDNLRKNVEFLRKC